MKLIAHRIFNDHRPLEEFDAGRVAGFHGVEMDVRRGPDGDVYVYHSPVFDARLGRRRTPKNRFDTAMELLNALERPPEVLLLDVKCLGAARHIANFMLGCKPVFDVVFNCWQGEAVAILRAALPEATILFCIAPLFAPRLARVVPPDFHLHNQYPFLSAAEKYQPKREKLNRHNINIKIFSDENAERIAPRDADGVCLHRVFYSTSLAEFAERRGLKTAVYGVRSRSSRLLRDAEERIDYAIVRTEKRAQRKKRRAAQLAA